MPFIDHQPPQPVCRSREHNPPSHMVLPAGTHTYQCPSCGYQTTFTVAEITCSA